VISPGRVEPVALAWLVTMAFGMGGPVFTVYMVAWGQQRYNDVRGAVFQLTRFDSGGVTLVVVIVNRVNLFDIAVLATSLSSAMR